MVTSPAGWTKENTVLLSVALFRQYGRPPGVEVKQLVDLGNNKLCAIVGRGILEIEGKSTQDFCQSMSKVGPCTLETSLGEWALMDEALVPLSEPQPLFPFILASKSYLCSKPRLDIWSDGTMWPEVFRVT